MDGRKTVLITGCRTGIGRSLALEFQRRGLRVFATARQAGSQIADLAALPGIETLDLEVTDAGSIDRVEAEIRRRTGGRLDLLVNNAGRNYTVPAVELDFDEVRQTFDVNVFAVMRICQVFAPMLIAARGVIAQIGSVAAVSPYVLGSVYNASKAALHQYSSTLRVELAPFGVSVVTVVTGGVVSEISRTRRVLKPDSIFLPISSEYERRQQHSQEIGMATDEYARTVVDQLLRPKPSSFIWAGAKANLVWVASWLPSGLFDWWFTREFSLWKLSSPPDKKSN